MEISVKRYWWLEQQGDERQKKCDRCSLVDVIRYKQRQKSLTRPLHSLLYFCTVWGKIRFSLSLQCATKPYFPSLYFTAVTWFGASVNCLHHPLIALREQRLLRSCFAESASHLAKLNWSQSLCAKRLGGYIECDECLLKKKNRLKYKMSRCCFNTRLPPPSFPPSLLACLLPKHAVHPSLSSCRQGCRYSRAMTSITPHPHLPLHPLTPHFTQQSYYFPSMDLFSLCLLLCLNTAFLLSCLLCCMSLHVKDKKTPKILKENAGNIAAMLFYCKGDRKNMCHLLAEIF